MQDIFSKLALFKEIVSSKRTRTLITGTEKSYRLYSTAHSFSSGKKSVLFVCGNEYEAKKYYDDFIRILPEDDVLLYPKQPFYFSYSDSYSQQAAIQRLNVLNASFSEDKKLIVTSAFALCEKFPVATRDNYITFRTGDEVGVTKLVEKLAGLGYERSDVCEAPGQFAVRGGIVDFFAPDQKEPVRVEFWDDEVDSVRVYSPQTMLSVGVLDEFRITPCSQYIVSAEWQEKIVPAMREASRVSASKIKDDGERKQYEQNSSEFLEKLSLDPIESMHLGYAYCDVPVEGLLDLYPDAQTVICDLSRFKNDMDITFRSVMEDFTLLKGQGYAFSGQEDIFYTYKEIRNALTAKGFTAFTSGVAVPESEYDREVYAGCADVISYRGNLNAFASQLPMYISDDYKVILTYSDQTEKAALSNLMLSLGIIVSDTMRSGSVYLFKYSLIYGMDFAKDRILLVPYSHIAARNDTSGRRKKTDQTKDFFSDIKPGDYVVHETHGIGRYEGISQVSLFGVLKDYIKIAYADEDTLYVPPEQMDLIQKYVGASDAPPRLTRMSSGEWSKTKNKVRKAVKELADEYIRMYSERQHHEGYPFSPDTAWQGEFEENFEFEPTEDQVKCAEEIKRDMEKPVPMDRLLLGDVGFGKTEVAARAAFKAVMEPKQVAILVPTTILALQHYNNFTQRFSGYPIKIAMLSRFKSAKEIKKTLEELKKGDVDIVIGTHRLLSKDVQFNDLGLLIVDEEQRFGVADKDKLKLLKTNVDTLTLSATPIPRTLNMSLTGIMDMSTINTPPLNKMEVQTYVTEMDDVKIKQAINFELSRGGQVFYLYNRVQDIDRVAEHISSIIPGARVVYAHGQMQEKQLENIIMDFLEQKYDILVSTTIIENGVDMINANTIIIQDADRLGLSQLYQLRGRVGRRDRSAFAYMMYQRNKQLSEDAAKRLSAIKEFTKFGSGFRVAMRDLQIRGAGNILGANQSGHFSNVGYEMYMRLLGEAVAEASGEKISPKRSCEMDLRVSAYLPNDYVRNETQRIELYKTIADIRNTEDYSRVIDEITDVYSDMPDCVLNLLKIALIKSKAEKVGIRRMRQNDTSLVIDFEEDTFFDGQVISDISRKYPLKIKNTENGTAISVKLNSKISVLELTEQLMDDFICNITE